MLRANSPPKPRSPQPSLPRACYHLGSKALPTTLALAATTVGNTLAFSFVGRYSDESSQAAHGLGYSVGNLLCLMIGFGLIGGLDSLCPQAVGRGQRWRCWVFLFHAIVVVFGVLFVAAPFLWWSGHLLTLANQDPQFARQVQQYLRAALPGLLSLCVFEALRKFLVYHGRIRAQNFVSLGSIGVQAAALWLLVDKLQLGPLGAGVARSITATTAVLLVIGYLVWARESLDWRDFREWSRGGSSGSSSSGGGELRQCERRDEVDLESASAAGARAVVQEMRFWSGLCLFIRLALPAALMCAAEWISYEAMVVEATALGATELTALSTAQALASLCFVASSALALQTTSEVGRALGRKDVEQARLFAAAGLVLACALPVGYGAVMLGMSSDVAGAFSNSAHVREIFIRNLPLLSLLVTVDCLHVCVCGILKALGFAWFGATADLVGLLGVMQISGLVFAFYFGLKSAGFILGSIVGVCVSVGSGLTFLYMCADWHACVAVAAAAEREGSAEEGNRLVRVKGGCVCADSDVGDCAEYRGSDNQAAVEDQDDELREMKGKFKSKKFTVERPKVFDGKKKINTTDKFHEGTRINYKYDENADDYDDEDDDDDDDDDDGATTTTNNIIHARSSGSTLPATNETY